jgi:BlaI family penicillinase repressor
MRLTDSEWQIMNALWNRHPATAREVAEDLPPDIHWAYTTLKTLLARLVAKQAVSEHKRGNTSVYEPLVSREEARHTALSTLLGQAFDGAVEPMLHFLARNRRLSEKERRELIQLLQEEDEKEGESP